MKFLSLAPFIPSGKDFGSSRQLFQELGFTLKNDSGGYALFERDGCRFILQDYDNKSFAENLMVSVGLDNVAEFRAMVLEKRLMERYGVRVGEITEQPYGKEVNLIDIAGVCWHFVE